jgi:ABC-2 type transport system permease protein
MNTHSNAMPESSLGSQAPAVFSATRPMYWSIRREFWENRSIYIAPLAAASLFLFGFMISLIHLPAKVRAAAAVEPGQRYNLIEHSYMLAALLIMATTFIVALFYCLDALHGERRDRSILFWKSLPVSDLVTVLSKAGIPIFILPLLTFAITVALWIMMWMLSGVVLLGSGLRSPTESLHFSLFTMSLMLLYHLLGIHGLWYAPIYGWLILVSAWARRAAFLWATVPLLAIGIVEKVAFSTSHFAHLLGYRFSGGAGTMGSTATGLDAVLMPDQTVGQFLINPGLWTGFALTALFLALAMRVRRSRGPI